jgi:dihydrofolate reductase
MGKIILYMQISLDGVVSDVGKWMAMSDEILEDSLAYYDSLDAMVVGGNSYSSLAEYWQNAEKASGSSLEREFARKINAIKKIVVSRSKIDLVWSNSQQLAVKESESLVREMENLKRSSQKDISVESGVRAWQLFLENSLFDELMLFVNPVVVGQGKRLFSDAGPKVTLRLIGSKVFQNGVVALHYQKI